MGNVQKDRNSRAYEIVVSAAGIAVWLIAVATILADAGWQEQLIILAMVPVIVTVGMFLQHFRLPLGLKFTRDRITFTLADACILLVACWLGLAPAVFLAGIEGFTSSRRTVRRLQANLFSSGMMSMGAAAASLTLHIVLRYAFGEHTGTSLDHSLFATAVAMLAASMVQIAVNIALLSTLFMLRNNNRALDVLKGYLETRLT